MDPYPLSVGAQLVIVGVILAAGVLVVQGLRALNRLFWTIFGDGAEETARDAHALPPLLASGPRLAAADDAGPDLAAVSDVRHGEHRLGRGAAPRRVPVADAGGPRAGAADRDAACFRDGATPARQARLLIYNGPVAPRTRPPVGPPNRCCAEYAIVEQCDGRRDVLRCPICHTAFAQICPDADLWQPDLAALRPASVVVPFR